MENLLKSFCTKCRKWYLNGVLYLLDKLESYALRRGWSVSKDGTVKREPYVGPWIPVRVKEPEPTAETAPRRRSRKYCDFKCLSLGRWRPIAGSPEPRKDGYECIKYRKAPGVKLVLRDSRGRALRLRKCEVETFGGK